MPRNPAWTRDELILALDLYFQVNPTHTNERHPKILALSRLLNSLPIHPRKSEFENFRNPNGVYMKLCNYLRFDPTYQGVGLRAGGRLEEEVWREFAPHRNLLIETAKAMGFLFTVTMGKLFTMTLGIQLTISRWRGAPS